MGFTVLIPARLASTRLPDKPLGDIAGLPMVVRVAERAARSGAEAAPSGLHQNSHMSRSTTRITASTSVSRQPNPAVNTHCDENGRLNTLEA